MPRSEAWDELDPRETILFVGSGFSVAAKNKEGRNFLTGDSLSDRFQEVLGYQEGQSVPLADIADDFVPDRLGLMYRTLYPLMVATKISPEQLELVKRPWRRVYTTNYDDVFEFGLQQIGEECESLTFRDPVTPPKKDKLQVVHLHGYIHRCDEDNVDDELVLTRSSYVRQQAMPQPWFDQFRNDIRFAAAVIFVGYSLSDIPINSLLLGGAEIREKTSFITREESTERFSRRVSRYGTIRPIALTGLARHLGDLAQKSKPSASKHFRAFVEMNPARDKKPLDPPTTIEVRNLLLTGKFHQRAAAATFGEARYVVPRQDKIDQAISSFAKAKTLLVHSRIGNGKTVFCELLAIALAEKGYRCIRARSDPRLTANDLRLLKSTQRIVIFFRSFDDAVAAMQQIGEPRPDMHFVVEIPTRIANVRANELRHLRGPFERIDLNLLSDQDKDDFENILNLAGLRPRNFDQLIAPCREIRDLIIKLFEDATVRELVRGAARPIAENPSLRRAMVESFAFKCLELSLSPTMERALFAVDPVSAFEAADEDLGSNIEDLFRLEDSRIEPWSAVVSEFLLSEMITAADLTDWALRVATTAGRIKRQEDQLGQRGYRFREANRVLGKVLLVSDLRRLMARCDDREDKLRDMFERARHEDVINAEPLFWLQFSILVSGDHSSYEDLELARTYLDTAYQRAEKLENFQTYQLDTHALRLMFALETHPDHPKGPFVRTDEMVRLLERFAQMLSDGSHRSFVLRVLPMAKDFVVARDQDIERRDRSILARSFEDCAAKIEALPQEIRLSEQADAVGQSLKQAAARLYNIPPS